MRTSPKSLKKGIYVLRCRDKTMVAAATNGHSAIWPEADARCDGKWVKFFREGKEVFLCNASYAATHFEIVATVQS